ncbi:MAG: class I SAM-dependent methyltransferase [Sulfuricellaceae bacterium]|jgi:SAM-dependent MidA family methyltransferase
MAPLPAPSPDALHHSERLATLIGEEIAAAGGWLSFARYMDLALYAPGLGYYAAGAHKLGAAGDFVTAPELSVLFGRTLARQAAQVLETTGGDILEIGAGTGKLARDLLRRLETLGRLPRRYAILEASADLKQRQHDFLAREVPHLVERVEWLAGLPAAFTGLILGNELLDALPAHVVAWRDGKICERGVAVENGKFVWRERPAENPALLDAARKIDVADGYVSEIGLAAPDLVRALGERLERGALLFLDYGFGHAEYYHPQRHQGTLMCHYRHHAHDDPFFLPGLQDITVHVDFSAIAEAGTATGLDLLGYTSQAHFLLNCGLTDLLAEVSPLDTAAFLPLANQAQRLLSPAEMGELFKVIALGRGIEPPLSGFVQGDKRYAL